MKQFSRLLESALNSALMLIIGSLAALGHRDRDRDRDGASLSSAEPGLTQSGPKCSEKLS